MNDREREMWVRNDEGLYHWWKREMGGEKNICRFIRENREELDKVITKRKKHG